MALIKWPTLQNPLLFYQNNNEYTADKSSPPRGEIAM
jgi:hypothetical protein